MATIDLIGIINDLNYTRLSGTENGEVKAKEYLAGKFKELGFEPVIEPARWSEFSTNVLIRLIPLVIFAGLLAALAFDFLGKMYPGWALVNLVFIPAIIASLVLVVNAQQAKTDSFAAMGKQEETFNMHVKIEGTGGGKIKDVLFVSHHDTKSQKVTTMIRTISYVLGFGLSLALGLLFIVSSLLQLFGIIEAAPITSAVLVVVFCVDAVFMSILVYNRTIEGKSVGSLDNATGMAIVLKLLEDFKVKGKELPFNTWYVILGAEEYGMCGAIEFWREHGENKKELDPATTMVFNYDMVAKELNYISHHGMPKKPYNKRANELIETAARELGVPVKGFWLPMLGTTDGWIFRGKGCDTADVVTRETAKLTHSAQDNPSACDAKTMEQAVAVTKRVVERLAGE